MKVSVYIATSLDGFIARSNGDLDWLPQFGANDEDYGYHEFMDTVDALVMGRRTFEKVLTFGDNWPYGDKPVVVLSGEPLSLPKHVPSCVQNLHGSFDETFQSMIQLGYDHIYLDGGVTAQRYLQAGLVDRYIVTVIPVLIGSGLPLFGALEEDVPLSLTETKSWPSGLVQYCYDVVRSSE